MFAVGVENYLRMATFNILLLNLTSDNFVSPVPEHKNRHTYVIIVGLPCTVLTEK
jgi:hypothetical protein